MKKHVTYHLTAALNSYSILFFSQNKVLGMLLLLASFLNFNAGLSGLIALVLSLFISAISGLNEEINKTGLYTFNSLLLGIGFGTFFNFNIHFWTWLLAAVMLCTILSAMLTAVFGKRSLPVLSIPFILVFWLVLAASSGNLYFGLAQKESYLLFELSNYLDNSTLPSLVQLFFRSVSAMLFQNSILAGIIVSIGLLIHSRIAFSLLVIGFLCALGFNHLFGVYPEGISNYHMGVNFMMIAVSIGGFFLVPSWRSFLWAILSIPVIFVVVLGLSKMLEPLNLPVVSMPFCLVNISLLYFLLLRTNSGNLQLTPYQYYSPEKNLYHFLNGLSRVNNLKYFKIALPFMGTWSVAQGYDGDITHKGEWSKALDFVITDAEQKTYQMPGNKAEDYYCFNKPVLACADGVVEEVIDYVADNEIGNINLTLNWGNTIVVRHSYGLYSKISHLKHKSAKVKAGDYVKEGDILALCGNSGRSPEPHLHFQLQSTPYIGSKTISYPFAAYISANQYFEYCVPAKGDLLTKPEIDYAVKTAFDFKPGFVARITAEGREELWEVFTDAYNDKYFYNEISNSIAYFSNGQNGFCFTNFYGSKQSLLYLFYLSAYQVNYSFFESRTNYPLLAGKQTHVLWLQDLIAPFYRFTKLTYVSNLEVTQSKLAIHATGSAVLFANKTEFLKSVIHIEENKIDYLAVNFKNKTFDIKWDIED